jgi:hypothetical protein
MKCTKVEAMGGRIKREEKREKRREERKEKGQQKTTRPQPSSFPSRQSIRVIHEALFLCQYLNRR